MPASAAAGAPDQLGTPETGTTARPRQRYTDRLRSLEEDDAQDTHKLDTSLNRSRTATPGKSRSQQVMGQISETMALVANSISAPQPPPPEAVGDRQHGNLLWCRYLAGQLNAMEDDDDEELKYQISGIIRKFQKAQKEKRKDVDDK